MNVMQYVVGTSMLNVEARRDFDVLLIRGPLGAELGDIN
jgi:hypothetical protein